MNFDLCGKNETAADLARAAGHHEVAAFLDSYPVMHPGSDRCMIPYGFAVYSHLAKLSGIYF